jgi:hypothetical protein
MQVLRAMTVTPGTTEWAAPEAHVVMQVMQARQVMLVTPEIMVWAVPAVQPV